AIARRCRWPQLDHGASLRIAPASEEGAGRAPNSVAAAARLWRARRPGISAGRILRPGAGGRGRPESMSGKRPEKDRFIAGMGGSTLRDSARSFLAHDHAADA